MAYDEKKGGYIAEGDVVITKGAQFLYAQKATYHPKTGIANVSGDVRFESAGNIFTGDKGFFDVRKKTGRINNGALFLTENHYYIKGDVIEKFSEDSYLIRNCLLTTCDGPNPDWTIQGSEIKVTIEGYGEIKNASFRVRDFPLVYAPYLIFPAKTKRQSGLLLPRAGYSSRNGVDVEAPFFWAISDQTDATFYQRFLSKRGYMQGLEFRYTTDKNSSGTLLFDILRDRHKKDMNDRDDLKLSPYDRTNDTRYWLRGKADMDLAHGLVARMDIDFVSDQDYLKEFKQSLFGFQARPDLEKEWSRPMEEKRSPTRRSGLRISHDSDDHSFQALFDYHQQHGEPAVEDPDQPVMGLKYISLPEQFRNLPVFFGLESEYGFIWRDEENIDPAEKLGQSGHRFTLAPELKFPFWLFGSYLEFEPSFRYILNARLINFPDKSDYLDNVRGTRDNQYKRVYEAGLRMSASAERFFDFQFHNLKKLRHKISPVLSYTYRVDQDENKNSPWFEQTDEEGDANLVTLSIENFLDARLGSEDGILTYRQWATLDLIQAYNITEARRDRAPGDEKKEPFEPLTAVLSVTPFPTLDLKGRAAWDYYDSGFSYAALSLDLTVDRLGGKMDTYAVDYIYTRDAQKSLNFDFDINIYQGFSVGCSVERDMSLENTISGQYWMGYKSQCWGLKIGLEEDEDTSIMIVVDLMGLGEVKP